MFLGAQGRGLTPKSLAGGQKHSQKCPGARGRRQAPRKPKKVPGHFFLVTPKTKKKSETNQICNFRNREKKIHQKKSKMNIHIHMRQILN